MLSVMEACVIVSQFISIMVIDCIFCDEEELSGSPSVLASLLSLR